MITSPSRRVSTRRPALLAAAAALAGLAVAAVPAASPVETGVVVVNTNLTYEQSAAAGTGMVLTSAGEVLTNNHVIRGATRLRVVDPRTRRGYRAQVLGYDVAADVAVLKLQGASGLRTVSIGNSARLRVGQAVTAVGNAGGTGTLATAAGTITGLRRTITASDGQGGSERLTGLIRTSAALQPGDSGGPLLDAAGKVVGMDTAASAGFSFRSSSEGYAIPIARALAIAKQIVAGPSSASVHVGPTAFLGVQIERSTYLRGDGTPAAGEMIASVVPGSPADRAGLVSGEVVTSLDGHAVESPAALATLVLRKSPGSSIEVAWVDQLGNTGTATVTLASGPPQ